MKNVEVIKLYVAGMNRGKTKTLRIAGLEGERLMNYETCLVHRFIDESGFVKYIVNETRYSSSTSRIQSLVREIIPTEMIHKTMTDVTMGANSLN